MPRSRSRLFRPERRGSKSLEARPFELSTSERASKRAGLERERRERVAELEEQWRRQQEQAERQEEERVRQLRRSMVPEITPLPRFYGRCSSLAAQRRRKSAAA